MGKHNMVELQDKLKQLNKETTFYLNEIKKLISTSFNNNELKLISYFTYTMNISHEKESESLIIGTYHIQNIGDKTINSPYICLKLSPNSPFHFSGKYITKITNLAMKTNDAWERLNNQTDKEEFWLKPIGKKTIEPTQILSFSNFQAKWIPSESYIGSIMGFTYCDEFKEGIPAINQINVSGN
ncbi:hypothetical protein [Metabacillus halosaccharovorans]|uniref:Uncharacterized protein n=1 Tax=Metabacillus halosaccharovorans TaxID=930124 RepID=A0ABT3DEE0_9BACI|nr:hypothetical protein [Metabacillus halosaccharovorans]MCV9885438.1 hypothetical protein [Metabacillus halosaccharovorans]